MSEEVITTGGEIVRANLGYPTSSDGKGMVTSLPMDDPAYHGVFLNAMQGQLNDLDDSIGIPFTFKNYILYPSSYRKRDTGEIIEGQRLVIIGDNGFMMGTYSTQIIESLKLIFLLKGNPPFPSPVRLVIKSATGKNGGRRFFLELLDS